MAHGAGELDADQMRKKMDDQILTIAESRMRGTMWQGRVYIDKADVVAWLRRCALESPGEIPSNTARHLAEGLEKMEDM